MLSSIIGIAIWCICFGIGQSLNNQQWNSINHILKNKNPGFNNVQIQTRTREIIYNSYEKWAVQQSHVFKIYHYSLCRNLDGDELAIYGCIGLKNAVQNYNPDKCGMFTTYAEFYLKSELYRGVKKLLPLASLDEDVYDNILDCIE